ncbi:cytochrome P450 family monooxygenase pc-3 [Rhizoctonia solani AG-3 Rhs1AP]|uniref:Cytochrome P450 family monooxygenase pc-3 n=1 Tax=Rhizoctonia solani AG-3 Rhs1AP TaxID=1086054 RepID=X8IZK5_9AGAM|nr:cytochrome P450 family monooxygenase pc-3 [Rhizoctonia solani AG-3 Rhs1AP]
MLHTPKWGAGLSIVLQSLPALLTSPIVAIVAPNILARITSPDTPFESLKVFLALPESVQAAVFWISYVVFRKIVQHYQRRADRRRLGADVVEVPRVKMTWPWNLDLIPLAIQSRKTDYCGAPWDRFAGEYGYTFNLGMFGKDQIMTFEPENIKAILSTDFNSYEKGPAYREKMKGVLGQGVFNADGDMWKFHRGMSRPYFSRDRISHFDNFARHSDITISKILSRLNEPARLGLPVAVDFQDAVARFTLDSGTEFLFGQSVRSLEAPLPYPYEAPNDDSSSFTAAFAGAQDLMMNRLVSRDLWPWMELFSDHSKEQMKVINSYVTPILKRKLEEARARGLDSNSKATSEDTDPNGSQEAGDTLLDHLIRITDDISVIKDELINILIAARDTTAATLTFAVYILAGNPQIMTKLRDEVLGRLGTSNHPTPNDFKEMKYLRALLNETLRLFPPVPINERTAMKSTVLHSGGKKYYVPAGATMPYSVLHMHRRKDLWGPDAEEFDPERWLDERLNKYLTPNPFIFLPFNAGPRICIGQQFAYNEASYFLSRLVQRVESLELVPEAHPDGTLPPSEWKSGAGRKVYEKIWPKSHLTIYSDGGLWVKMKEASPVSE